MKPMKPLILTDEQRANMHVTYDSGKYCLYCKEGFGFVFLSSYLSKEDLIADMKLNKINPKLDRGAALKYLTEEIGKF